MIFSFVNQKGGVGKTTTVLNLGAFVAKAGKKVLAVDLDPQGNLTSGLGGQDTLQKKDKQTTVYDVLVNNANISNSLMKTEIDNLSLLPANIDLAGAEIEIVNKIARESLLKKVLKNIKDKFDYIFIDCPPSLGLLTINALVAAPRIIIPIQCEYFALEGLRQLAQTMEMIRSNLNGTLQVGGVVLTMFDVRTKLSKSIVAEVKDYFKGKVFETIIPRNVKLSEAPSFGKPIVLYDKKAKGSVAYKNLAKEFVKRF